MTTTKPQPLTHEEVEVWMNGDTMPITRHENMERVLALLDENATLKAENAEWRKATGRDDPEALDFELGRTGIDTHLMVLTDRAQRAEAERDTLKADVERLKKQRDELAQLTLDQQHFTDLLLTAVDAKGKELASGYYRVLGAAHVRAAELEEQFRASKKGGGR